MNNRLQNLVQDDSPVQDDALDDYGMLPAANSEADKLASVSRLRKAFLASKRGELLTPVHGVIDICDRLLWEVKDRGAEELEADLKKIQKASRRLSDLVHDILAPASLASHATDVDFDQVQSRLRHELLNELNPVINYSEMWLEDAEDSFLDEFVPDLKMIYDAGKRCLDLIDTILHSWNMQTIEISENDVELIRAMAGTVLDEDRESNVSTVTGRVLIADDNETNRDILRRRLEVQGHQVEVASNGRETMELVRRNRFDLILLDIVMPEMDGFEVLVQLKQDDRFRDIPVIMISALDQMDIVVRCVQLGAEDYLSKPFNPTLLRARIGACLEKRRLMEQIKREKQRADDLLQVILPQEIISELKATNQVKPRGYDDVAVMFADIVDFTPYCEKHVPEVVVAQLQQMVEQWEEVAVRFGVEKIKTIGDAFMAACGLLKEADSPVMNCIRCGLVMLAAAKKINWELRIGIHFGRVVGGVLGRRQYLFDLWGDTVNTAARIESKGTRSTITLSKDAWDQVASECHGTSLGTVLLKGKGGMELFRFDGFRKT